MSNSMSFVVIATVIILEGNMLFSESKAILKGKNLTQLETIYVKASVLHEIFFEQVMDYIVCCEIE